MIASLLRNLALATPAAAIVLAGCGAGSSAPAAPSGQAGISPASTAPASLTVKPAAAASASGNTAALTKFSIPYSAIAASNTPFWMPIEAGLYKKYGLDVSTEYVASSATLMPSLLSGETPLAAAGEDAVINANLNGGDIAIVGAGIDHFLFSIYAPKSINSVAE